MLYIIAADVAVNQPVDKSDKTKYQPILIVLFILTLS
jgi:hypothetical protein